MDKSIKGNSITNYLPYKLVVDRKDISKFFDTENFDIDATPGVRFFDKYIYLQKLQTPPDEKGTFFIFKYTDNTVSRPYVAYRFEKDNLIIDKKKGNPEGFYSLDDLSTEMDTTKFYTLSDDFLRAFIGGKKRKSRKQHKKKSKRKKSKRNYRR